MLAEPVILQAWDIARRYSASSSKLCFSDKLLLVVDLFRPFDWQQSRRCYQITFLVILTTQVRLGTNRVSEKE
jgi:hypothetical protein